MFSGRITGSSNNLAPFSSTSMKDRISKIIWSNADLDRRFKYFRNLFLCFLGIPGKLLNIFLVILANVEATGFAAYFNSFLQSLSQIKEFFCW